ncbi:thioesterase II family protein [Vibrio pectenicida]|uniref:Thioesterase n=1 Tax=Vibrio pectenicida TaxID=62763 RepID=A0A427TZX5_9VIBR|nr:thioesterase domain-containing protein [Vibrio pectenicida]RSD30001.1 thioesterase [Vibrio pectenicida]
MSPLIKLATSSGSHHDTHYIVCPFAGGASGAFRTWRDLSLDNETISVMVYPGREFRIDEPAAPNIDVLAQDVVQNLLNSNQPIERMVIVGHSMGTQVAYEVCKTLIFRGYSPKGLVISACHAPHIEGRRLIGECDDRVFIEHLVDMGGCDPSLSENPQWWPIFLPALRADFDATEQYFFASPPSKEERLSIPTLLISGDEDQEAYFSEVEAWKLWFNNVINHKVIKGNHFYVTSQPQIMLESLRSFSSQAINQ